MVRRVRRSRRSQSRYCGLGMGVRPRPAPFQPCALQPSTWTSSSFQRRVEVAVELGRVARGERRRAAAIGAGEADGMVRLHAARPPRQHDDALRHADRLADVVRHQDRGLALAAQDFGHLVGERDAGLRIERRERLVEQHDVRLGAERAGERHALAHAARQLARQVMQELSEPIAREQLRRALAGAAHVGALDFGAEHRVLEDRAPLEQVVLLQHVADLAARPGDRRRRRPARRLRSASRMPEISDSSVLLPQPLWPMMATNSPGAIVSDMSLSASVSPSRPK